MNLAILHFTQGLVQEFPLRAGEAGNLALALEEWEPLSKLSWLRGRLALSDSATCRQGLTHCADALRYAAEEGEATVMDAIGRVDEQAERMLSQGLSGRPLVLSDYLLTFVSDQGFSRKVQAHLTRRREDILRRDSLP